jgi:hypothetical protein
MRDFSDWKEYEGTSEGSGRSEKIWLKNIDTGETGLFKYKKDVGTTDNVSECIANQIAKVLEIPCARFELGTYMGKEGSMSYNIIEEHTQTLIEGIHFIALRYPDYNSERFFDEKTQHRYSIEMVVKSIENFVPIDDFLKMLIFDYLIGNTDRHQSNWAVIMENSKMRWSPLYDNSSSLCAYVLENQIESYFGKDTNKWRSLVDTKSKSMLCCTVYDEKRPTHLTVLKYIKDNYYTETYRFAKKIVDYMNDEQINSILNMFSSFELSDNKKKLICKFLLSKIHMLEEVYVGKDD